MEIQEATVLGDCRPGDYTNRLTASIKRHRCGSGKEVAQWVKCWMHKRKDMSSDPQHHIYSWVQDTPVISVSERWREVDP